MKNYIQDRDQRRQRRVRHVSKRVRGIPTKPRLVLHKSNKHLFSQVIDDTAGMTVVSFSTMSKEAKVKGKGKAAAQCLGQRIGELIKLKKLDTLVFDRRHYKYHGTVAAFVQAVRDAGINI